MLLKLERLLGLISLDRFNILKMKEIDIVINISICDDDKNITDEIHNLIKKHFPKNIDYQVSIYYSGEELIEKSNDTQIDILFIDIEMGEISGIQTVKYLREYNSNCIVFFVTSYNNYITDLFRLQSFQFLQKPINEKDFVIDLNRAIEEYNKNHSFIEIKHNNTIKKVQIGEILYIEVYQKEIKIKTFDDVIYHRGKIIDYEQKLSSYHFAKSHKSFIINLKYIVEIKQNSVMLKSLSHSIPLGRKYRNLIINEYNKYNMGKCI